MILSIRGRLVSIFTGISIFIGILSSFSGWLLFRAAILHGRGSEALQEHIGIFLGITAFGVLTAAAVGCVLGYRMFLPIHRLIDASRNVSEGELEPDIGPVSKNAEIGLLQKTFLEMVASIRERDKEIIEVSERKLLQSEKQASIGRLAAGVAHEINNPLTGVLTFSYMLLKRTDLPEDMLSDLKTIADATERVREIVKGLLDFSRQTVLNPVPADINELINETISLVGNQALVKGVMLCFHPKENIPPRILDKNQIQSVLINILMNAIDSTEKGGHIVISSGQNMRGVEITISDTGCGIPEEHLDKLFDPFFSTKEVGEGTGLGLAVSYGIIEKHGGEILVDSTVGKGSTFIVRLPIDGQG